MLASNAYQDRLPMNRCIRHVERFQVLCWLPNGTMARTFTPPVETRPCSSIFVRSVSWPASCLQSRNIITWRFIWSNKKTCGTLRKSWTLAPCLKSIDRTESNTCNPLSACKLFFTLGFKVYIECLETKLGFVCDRTICGRQGRGVPNETVLKWMSRKPPRWMAVPIFNFPLIQEHQCCKGDLFLPVPRCVLKSSYNRCTWLMSSSKCRPPAVPLYRLNNTCGCFNALVFPPSPQKVAVLQLGSEPQVIFCQVESAGIRSQRHSSVWRAMPGTAFWLDVLWHSNGTRVTHGSYCMILQKPKGAEVIDWGPARCLQSRQTITWRFIWSNKKSRGTLKTAGHLPLAWSQSI